MLSASTVWKLIRKGVVVGAEEDDADWEAGRGDPGGLIEVDDAASLGEYSEVVETDWDRDVTAVSDTSADFI